MISGTGLILLLLFVLAPDVFLFPFSLVYWLLFNALDWFCRLMGWVTPSPRNGKHPNDKE
jgi:hypothetical protein